MVICFWWFTCGAFASSKLSHPLQTLVYKKEQAEGEFRFSLTMLFRHLEAILLSRGLQFENNKIRAQTTEVITTTRLVIHRHFWLNLFSETFSYSGSILNYTIIGFALYYGSGRKLSAGERAALLSKGTFSCLYLISGLSTILSSYLASADVLGLSVRIIEILHWSSSSDSFGDAMIKFSDRESQSLSDKSILLDIQGLAVNSPSGLPLITPITLQVRRGMRILIDGPSGCGKSTLLRHLAGLGSTGGSRVNFSSSKVVFLPQNPYIFRGTLFENIVYPWNIDDECSITKAAHLLKRMSLDYLEALYGLRTAFDLHSLLSQGEKQKLAICRCVFNSPEMVCSK